MSTRTLDEARELVAQDRGYLLVLKHCRSEDHESCPGYLDETSHVDPKPTVCKCCERDHWRGDEQVRITEWRINRNYLREGDPCWVKGVSRDCTFRALLTNGERAVEVFDNKQGRVMHVDPDKVRRYSKS